MVSGKWWSARCTPGSCFRDLPNEDSEQGMICSSCFCIGVYGRCGCAVFVVGAGGSLRLLRGLSYFCVGCDCGVKVV